MSRLIIPAILTESVADLQAKIDLAATFCERVCVDVIDGEFADNVTVMPEDLQGLFWHGLTREAQLMVTDPVDYLGLLHTAGFDRVYGHIERMSDMEEFAVTCEEMGIELGWALDLYTPIESIPRELLQKSNGVLLMSVKAGFSYQEYVDISSKIHELKKVGYVGDVVVDGGMNSKTIPELLTLGVNQFSVTSAIWMAKDPASSYLELSELL